jgi:FADH2 O2-dependent halogenase
VFALRSGIVTTARAAIDVDVAVIGSGFSGALTALGLLRRGKRVALIERGSHPRFAIGESSTPLANLLLEEFADRYGLPTIRAFSKWGAWQRAHANVAVGLKRGFSFFFHHAGERFEDDASHERSLLVAASPFDEIGDTHWYRQEFDHALVGAAQEYGAIYLDHTTIDHAIDRDSYIALEGVRNGRELNIVAKFVVDASGPRGALQRLLQLKERPFKWLPQTSGLYAHFRNVRRWEEVHAYGSPPYAPDDAALHHVFPGGWIWILRFNNGVTSAGAALTKPLARRLDGKEPGQAWRDLLQGLPSVNAQLASAEAVRPFVHAPLLAFRSLEIAGDKWALLPSAAGIIDPLLSTGFPLTFLGITRLLTILESTATGYERSSALQTPRRVSAKPRDVWARLIWHRGFYCNRTRDSVRS